MGARIGDCNFNGSTDWLTRPILLRVFTFTLAFIISVMLVRLDSIPRADSELINAWLA